MGRVRDNWPGLRLERIGRLSTNNPIAQSQQSGVRLLAFYRGVESDSVLCAPQVCTGTLGSIAPPETVAGICEDME